MARSDCGDIVQGNRCWTRTNKERAVAYLSISIESPCVERPGSVDGDNVVSAACDVGDRRQAYIGRVGSIGGGAIAELTSAVVSPSEYFTSGVGRSRRGRRDDHGREHQYGRQQRRNASCCRATRNPPITFFRLHTTQCRKLRTSCL